MDGLSSLVLETVPQIPLMVFVAGSTWQPHDKVRCYNMIVSSHIGINSSFAQGRIQGGPGGHRTSPEIFNDHSTLRTTWRGSSSASNTVPKHAGVADVRSYFTTLSLAG